VLGGTQAQIVGDTPQEPRRVPLNSWLGRFACTTPISVENMGYMLHKKSQKKARRYPEKERRRAIKGKANESWQSESG
jgi:hypothetical protein